MSAASVCNVPAKKVHTNSPLPRSPVSLGARNLCRDNHGLYINQAQMDELQARMGIPKGSEWEPFAGIKDVDAVKVCYVFFPSLFFSSLLFGGWLALVG